MRKPKLIRKRSSGRTEADRDVELFLANEQVDQIADYASRGRVYERLTDGELVRKKPRRGEYVVWFRNNKKRRP
jgi:hypothetical protein